MRCVQRVSLVMCLPSPTPIPRTAAVVPMSDLADKIAAKEADLQKVGATRSLHVYRRASPHCSYLSISLLLSSPLALPSRSSSRS